MPDPTQNFLPQRRFVRHPILAPQLKSAVTLSKDKTQPKSNRRLCWYSHTRDQSLTKPLACNGDQHPGFRAITHSY